MSAFNNRPEFPEAPVSPCVSICALDGDDICVGCFRTGREISYWGLLPVEERREVLTERGFSPSDSGPNALYTMLVVSAAAGFVPIPHAFHIGRGATGALGTLALGDDGKPEVVLPRKLAEWFRKLKQTSIKNAATKLRTIFSRYSYRANG